MPQTRAQIEAQNVKNPRAGISNIETPKKVRIQTLNKVYEHNGPTDQIQCRRQIFRQNKVSTRSGYNIIASNYQRTFPYSKGDKETRGRPYKVTNNDLYRCEQLITGFSVDGRQLSWEQLAFEADLNVSGRTLQRVIGTMGYCYCIACRKSWVSPNHAAKRVEFAQRMLT